MSTTPSTPMRDLLRSRGTELTTKRTDDALDAFCDASSRLTTLVDNGRVPTNFVTGLAEWLEQVVTDVEMGQPIPPLGSNTGKDSVKPEYRRVIQALDRGEIELDPTTRLPKAADDGSEVDNVLTSLERELKTSRISGEDNKDRLRRILDDAKKLGKTATDQLGEVAEALGLKKDADKADVIKTAKDVTSENEKLGEIAEALGLDNGATTDDIVAAAKAAKAGTPAKTGGTSRWGRGR